MTDQELIGIIRGWNESGELWRREFYADAAGFHSRTVVSGLFVAPTDYSDEQDARDAFESDHSRPSEFIKVGRETRGRWA